MDLEEQKQRKIEATERKKKEMEERQRLEGPAATSPAS